MEGDISYDVYNVVENECLPQFPNWWSTSSKNIPYLVDENVDITVLNGLSSENFESKLWDFIKFDEINPNGWWVNNSNPKTEETLMYKIVRDWNDYKLVLKFEDIVESETPFKCEDCVDAEEMVGTETPLKCDHRVDHCVDMEEVIDDESIDAMVENMFKKENTEPIIENNKLKDFCIAWILTILIEVVALFDIAKIFRKKEGISTLRLLLVWVIASTVTLPLLRFVLPLFIVDGVEYTVVWELLVTLIEVFIIKYWLKISWWKAILASVVCNLCSYLLGLLIM